MKRFASFLACPLAVASLCFADDPVANANPSPKQEAAVPAHPEVEIAKISEAFGHLISKNLETIGVQLDMHQVIKGLQDAVAGKTSPMTEVECIQAISSVQEKVFKKHCEENLRTAEDFLSKTAGQKDVISIEKGKVLYKVEKEGSGAAVEEHASPLIRYVGKFVDGATFSASKEDEMVSLDETIPGLKAAVLNMKEGEKRTIHIHPELAYGTQGFLPPNSMLTFEVEVVKANVSPIETAQETPSAGASKGSEIALPGDPVEAVR